MILLDTNIILRSKQSNSSHFKTVTNKLIELLSSGEELVICSQIIYEFYVVATRPIENNGLGLSSERGINEIENIIKTYRLVDDNKHIFENWKELVKSYRVSGKSAHDTKIVALMLSHKIRKLYTINIKDFKRFESLIELV